MTPTRTTIALAAVGVALLGGCGGSSTTEAGAPADDPTAVAAPAATEAAPSPKPTKASRCLPVEPEVLERIAGAAQDSVGTLTFSKGAAVKSKDFKSVYMIAGRFSAPGVKDEVGVWASNSLEPGGGLTFAVDGFAKQFTVLPDSSKTQAGITQSDDGVDEARNCL